MGVGDQRHSPAVSPLGKENRYSLYRRLGGPQGRSGRVRKNSPSPGFDPRSVQPVASRYTDWAIPARTVHPARANNCSTNNVPSAYKMNIWKREVSSTPYCLLHFTTCSSFCCSFRHMQERRSRWPCYLRNLKKRSMVPHPISLRYVLIAPFHLHLGYPNDLFLSRLSSKNLIFKSVKKQQ